MPETSTWRGRDGGLSRLMGSVYHMAALRYGNRPSLHTRGKKEQNEEDGDEDGDDEANEGDEDGDATAWQESRVTNDAAAEAGISATSQKQEVSQQTVAANRSRLQDALIQAEESYNSGHAAGTSVMMIRTNALRASGDASSSAMSAAHFRDNGVADSGSEGLERTRVRAMLAQTRSTAYDDGGGATTLVDDDAMDDELLQRGSTSRRAGRGRATSAEGTSDSIYLGDREAIMPFTRTPYDRKRAQSRQTYAQARSASKALVAKASVSRHQDDDTAARDPDVDEEAMARQTSMEIEQMKLAMPDSSLMAVVHFLASHYYESRDLMFPRTKPVVAKRARTGVKMETESGMLRACEGNALVAVAVYIEELAKWEAGLGTHVDAHAAVDASDVDRVKRRRDARARLDELMNEEAEAMEWTLRQIRRHRRRRARERDGRQEGSDDVHDDETQDEEDNVESAEPPSKQQRNERGRFAESSLRAWTGRPRMQAEHRRSLKRARAKKQRQSKNASASGAYEPSADPKQDVEDTDANDSDEAGSYVDDARH